jgi:putative phosphoesterase
MKIAIVSDTHNNIANFKKAIDWIKKENIQTILHCGDIMSQEVIDEALKYFGGEIKFVKGNGDHNLDFPEKMEIEINGKKIAFTHFPDIAKKLSQLGKFDLVFYGHTHRAWDEKIGNTHMINPGELAGQFYKPTFAVYDTASNSLELKILEKL